MLIVPPPIKVKQIKKRAPRTAKEKKFAKVYAETGNATESAVQAYKVKNRRSAAALGHKILSQVDISALMYSLGIDDTRLLGVLDRGLDAEEVNKLGTFPNYFAQHKFMETGLKLLDRFPATKNETKVDFKGMIEAAQKYVTP